MTEEEFQRIKEAEKEHLRAKKQLAELKRTLRRKKKIQSTVESMARGASSLLRRSADLVEQLGSDAARKQARLEVALDDTDAAPSKEDEADVAAYEAEQRAQRARQLIRQMKQDGGTSARSTRSDEAPSSSSPATDATSSPDDRSTTNDDDLPEKTIGRM